MLHVGLPVIDGPTTLKPVPWGGWLRGLMFGNDQQGVRVVACPWRLPDTDNGLASWATVDAASNLPVGFQTCTSDAQDGFLRPKAGLSLSKRPVSGFSVWQSRPLPRVPEAYRGEPSAHDYEPGGIMDMVLGDPGQPMQPPPWLMLSISGMYWPGWPGTGYNVHWLA